MSAMSGDMELSDPTEALNKLSTRRAFWQTALEQCKEGRDAERIQIQRTLQDVELAIAAIRATYQTK